MTTTANPYVAAREDPTRPWSGIVIAEDLEGIVHGIESGSWIEGGLGVVGTGLDALSFVTDPFGSLAAWGVGWLIEHVGPLRQALDALAGDPAQITAFAGTWTNVAKGAASEAANLRAQVDQLGSWVGTAGDAYRGYAGSHVEALAMVSKAAEGLSAGVTVAGMLVGTVRTIVRDLIAQFVGRLAVWAAEAIFTAGVGLVLVAEQATVAVEAMSVRIANLMRKLTSSLRKLGELLGRLRAIVAQLGQRLRRLPSSPEPRKLPHDPGYIGPERQLTGPSKRARQIAEQAEAERIKVIREGIERVDQELAAGTHNRRFKKEELDWLNADPRHKEIAYDTGPGTYRVGEAKQALAAEKLGVIPGPVKRSIDSGADILDGDGVHWSFKGTGPRPNVEKTVDLALNEMMLNQRTVLDLRLMSMRDQAAVRNLIVERLGSGAHPEIRFIPPGVERIPSR